MRKEKPLLLDEIREKIDGSSALFVAKYEKLEPNLSWQLRELLSKSNSHFEVVKKRVLMKAAEQTGIQIDASALEGHIGVLFVNHPDAMIPAKAFLKFSEENGDLIKMICGRIEGKMIGGAEAEELAKLPGMDEMRATLLALLVSPMSQLLSVLGKKSES